MNSKDEDAQRKFRMLAIAIDRQLSRNNIFATSKQVAVKKLWAKYEQFSAGYQYQNVSFPVKVIKENETLSFSVENVQMGLNDKIVFNFGDYFHDLSTTAIFVNEEKFIDLFNTFIHIIKAHHFNSPRMSKPIDHLNQAPQHTQIPNTNSHCFNNLPPPHHSTDMNEMMSSHPSGRSQSSKLIPNDSLALSSMMMMSDNDLTTHKSSDMIRQSSSLIPMTNTFQSSNFSTSHRSKQSFNNANSIHMSQPNMTTQHHVLNPTHLIPIHFNINDSDNLSPPDSYTSKMMTSNPSMDSNGMGILYSGVPSSSSKGLSLPLLSSSSMGQHLHQLPPPLHLSGSHQRSASQSLLNDPLFNSILNDIKTPPP